MNLPRGIQLGSDGDPRCAWPGAHPDYLAYHDHEWGRPIGDDCRLFEKLCLEGFQCGLSWLTILRKRPAFRRGFAGFDFNRVARFNRRSVERLLRDASIVRHRGKIESAINNARRALELRDEMGSLAAYVWRFEPAAAERPKRLTRAALARLTESAASRAMSRDLKARGWSFVGPTTLYAFMQSVGLVNDHIEGCYARDLAESGRRKFRRPQVTAG